MGVTGLVLAPIWHAQVCVFKKKLTDKSAKSLIHTECTKDVDMDRYGHDMEADRNAATVEICCRRCAATQGCKAYAYDPSNGNCWLKDEVGTKSAKSSRISGIVTKYY